MSQKSDKSGNSNKPWSMIAAFDESDEWLEFMQKKVPENATRDSHGRTNCCFNDDITSSHKMRIQLRHCSGKSHTRHRPSSLVYN